MIGSIVNGVQLFYLIYFSVMIGVYLFLCVVAVFSMRSYLRHYGVNGSAPSFTGREPSITLLIPAYNEKENILNSIRASLQLVYPDYEVIVVNDGSTDETLDILKREFNLQPCRDPYTEIIPTKPVRAIYNSIPHPKLKVIDKVNGGKGDAMNAAVNLSKGKLTCSVDSDSVLEPFSLLKAVRPFMEDDTTVVSGGQVCVLNGCEMRDGKLVKVGFPKQWLVRIQVLEYLRAYLVSRMGWSAFNALPLVSGTFGLIDKKELMRAGGFHCYTIAEDLDIVFRLHLMLRSEQRKYRIVHFPDPVCWTEVPKTFDELKRQRLDWHRALAEALMFNIKLLCNPKGGIVSWFMIPFMIVFEFFGTVVEVLGIFLIAIFALLGVLSIQALVIFTLLALAANMFLSVVSLLLEEMSFHSYPDLGSLFRLFAAVIFETPAYRLLTSYFRLLGVWDLILTYPAKAREIRKNRHL